MFAPVSLTVARRAAAAAPASSSLMMLRRPALAAAASAPLRRGISSGQPKKVNIQSLIEADTGAVGTKFYHLSNSALLIAAPLAFFLSPSILSFPLDLFLGVAFPLHAHIGFNYIISDYVPKASRSLARYALAGVTGITILGLTKLNFDGPGLTESFKSLWREERKK